MYLADVCRASRLTRARLVGLTVLIIAALALIDARSTSAHFTWPQYSYRKKDTCQGPTDPVSLYYYGSAAVNHRVTKDIKEHLRWGDHPDKQQYIRDHGACAFNYSSPASNSGFGKNRYHVRLWGMDHRDSNGRWETVGTPHHEDWVWFSNDNPRCGPPGGHAVDKGAVDRRNYKTKQGSGFDQGRRKIREKVNTRAHDIKIQYLGNTSSFKQCDDDYAGSNGNVLWVSMGRH